MISPSYSMAATERVLPRLALDFTTASLDTRVTFTRTTEASNPATFINSSGVITAATNNQPRFDYDPVTLVCKGLLIEESRTNSLLNTDLLSTQIVTVTAAVRTLSFYGTGSVTLSGAHTAVVSGTGAYPTRTTYSFTPTAGALTLTVTGTVQFAQLEAGAFATSYIPTTTTALTRNADVATMTGTNFSDWFNDSASSIQLQFNPVGSTANLNYINFDAGSNANAAYLYAFNNLPYFRIRSGNVTQSTLNNSGALVTGQQTGISFNWNNTAACTLAKNGADLRSTAGGVTLPVGINRLVFGNNAYFQKFNYFPLVFSGSETLAFSK